MAIKNFLKKHYRVLGLLFAITVSVLIFVFRNELMQLQEYGLFGLFFLNVIGSATLFFPTPLFLTAFVAGAVFNPILVAIIASLGSSIGEITGYLAGYGAEDVLEKDIKVQRVKKWMDRFGLWVIFVLAALPNPFFDLAGIVAGASEIPISKYLLVVWLGKLVKFGVIAYLGANSIVFLDRYI